MKNILGNNIQKRLTEIGMTQMELAYECGISEVSVSRYVRGNGIPKGPILVDIAKVLGTTAEKLMEEE